MYMHTSVARRLALALTASALTFGAAACGSDDDDEGASETTAAAAAPTTGGSAEGTAGTEDSGAVEGASVEAFCQAELEAEAAAQGEDPSQAGPAFEALVAAAPEEIRATTEAVIAAVQADVIGTPEFDEPYAEVIQYMKDNCGFNELEVTAADYSFTGLPAEVEAGPVIVSLENTGEELHEITLWRINDDVTEPVDEIMALPEEELFTKVTPKGGAFVFPGGTGYGTADLEPGRYIAVCQIPEGLTPEVAEELEATEGSAPEGSAPEGSVPEGSAVEGSAPEGSSPLGPPHHTLGMIQEFTVA